MRLLFRRRPLIDQFDRHCFRAKLARHLRRWAAAYLLLVVGATFFQSHYEIGVNASPSLPYRLFLIHKGELPQRGEYIAFRWPGGGPYPAGVIFVKIVAGTAGDTVTRADRNFYVNGVPVGEAKTTSRQGLPLEPGPVGVLPSGRYYVHAPHPDSLDSRYRLTSWVSADQIIGRAYALF